MQCMAVSRICRNIVSNTTHDCFHLNNAGSKVHIWNSHQRQSVPTVCRYYSRTVIAQTADRQFLSKCRHPLKWRTDRPTLRYEVRPSICGQINSWRVYCTKSQGDGAAALAHSSKKTTTAKMSEVKRLLALALPEKKPIFCK